MTGLSCGDQVPRPETDPTFTGWTFLGWFLNEEPYDFSRPVTHSATLVAGWAPEGSESFTLPKDMTVIEESAFEGIAARYIRIPDGCTTINPNAFKDCRELKFIRIPGSVSLIASTAFTNCSGVYVLGESGSMAETLCEGNDSFTFILSLEP
ncbi:MAG: leucine-rich repeat protein [Oscillospiraceae bacterium]|nr:leucine-rich repeat protein [Oscillospiraceae bacterium]